MHTTRTILLADDNQDDVFLFERALSATGLPARLNTVSSGEEALLYLKGEARFADRKQFPLPEILFLDFHTAGPDTAAVITSMRQAPWLKALPIIVLSGSPYSSETIQAYAAGANSFLAKPNRVEDLTACLRQTLNYWFKTSVLPEPSSPPAHGQT